MQTATPNTVPPHLQMGQNQSQVIVETPEDRGFHAVVFAGDLMTRRQRNAPGYFMGGRIVPEYQTVPNNLISRFAVTPLKQGMMSVHEALVDPLKRGGAGGYVKEYVATNIWNAASGKFEDVRVGGGGLLYKALPPAREVGQICRFGTVRVPHVESAGDIKEAQLYFFPDWIDIISGRKELPRVLRETEDDLQERIAASDNQAMKEIGAAFLQSCSEFRLFGTEYVEFQTKLIKDAEKVPGVYQAYDEVAETIFEMLEITRQDALITDFAKQQNNQRQSSADVGEALKMIAGVVANQQAAPQPQMQSTDIAAIVAAVMQQMSAPTVPNPLPPPAQDVEQFEQSLNSDNIATDKAATKTKGR